MGSKATTTDLITAARELFSCTAISENFWSDDGPQFTYKKFQYFSQNGVYTSDIPPTIFKIMKRLRLS